MEVLGLRLPLVKPKDDLPKLILKAVTKIGGFRDGDVVVISSKVVATAQGRLRDLAKVRPSAHAKAIANESGQSPEFVELVLREASSVLNVVRGAILTIKDGIICANAGADLSNVTPGRAVLMPSNPDKTAEELRRALSGPKARIGVIISDSVVKPLRLGTVGQALGVAGMEPVEDCRGQLDLYGKPLRITFRAVADQLATAAQAVMGEGNERVPLAVIRGAKVELVAKQKHPPKISSKRCIYFSKS